MSLSPGEYTDQKQEAPLPLSILVYRALERQAAGDVRDAAAGNDTDSCLVHTLRQHHVDPARTLSSGASHASSCNLPRCWMRLRLLAGVRGLLCGKIRQCRVPQEPPSPRKPQGLFLTRAAKRSCAGFHGAAVSHGRPCPPLPSV